MSGTGALTNEILCPEPVPFRESTGWFVVAEPGTAEVSVQRIVDPTSPAGSGYVMRVVALTDGPWPMINLGTAPIVSSRLPGRVEMLFAISCAVRASKDGGARLRCYGAAGAEAALGNLSNSSVTPGSVPFGPTWSRAAVSVDILSHRNGVYRPFDRVSPRLEVVGDAVAGDWVEVTCSKLAVGYASGPLAPTAPHGPYVCGARSETTRLTFGWEGEPFNSRSVAVRKPISRATWNFCTNPRPRRVEDAWRLSGSTATKTFLDEPGPEGRSGFVRYTVTEGPGQYGETKFVVDTPVEFLAGDSFTCSIWFRRRRVTSAEGSTLWKIVVRGLNGTTQSDAITWTSTTLPNDEWVRITISNTTPLKEWNALYGLRIELGPWGEFGFDQIGNNNLLDVESAMINVGPTPLDHFDGDTPPTDGFAYRWDGEPGRSSSTRIDLSDLRIVDASSPTWAWDGSAATEIEPVGGWDGSVLYP